MKKLLAAFLIAVTFTGILAHNCLHNERKFTLSASALPQNQIVWPAAGEAAIGTVKDGVLARSSEREEARPTASLAKVITALAVVEKQPLELGQDGPVYIINQKDMTGLDTYLLKGGSVLPLVLGMKLTLYQAMQRMLMASDNNMADLLVERIFGSMAEYVSYAREMLKRMGLNLTVVADASGFSPATVSTPSELVAIGIAALKNPLIAGIVSRRQVRLPVVGLIKNTNQLLGSDGITGIKTGTTDKAGSCLLFSARYLAKDGQDGTLVCVIMGARSHSRVYSDSKNLLASAKLAFGAVQPPSTARFIGPMRKNPNGPATLNNSSH